MWEEVAGTRGDSEIDVEKLVEKRVKSRKKYGKIMQKNDYGML